MYIKLILDRDAAGDGLDVVDIPWEGAPAMLDWLAGRQIGAYAVRQTGRSPNRRCYVAANKNSPYRQAWPNRQGFIIERVI